MNYIDYGVLSAISGKIFRATKPFPWLNPQDALLPDAFSELQNSLPDIGLFKKTVGIERSYGQKPHDRYELKYDPALPLSPAWRSFIDEIFGEEYQRSIARIFGTNNFTTRCQWQYAYAGCSVSPHCDSPTKLGSQIFYMNTPDDWKDEWGGRTLVLDDEGTKDHRSAPDLSEFRVAAASEIIPNRSFIFMRTNHSWHAVEELTCPPGMYRKLFTVVFDRKPSLVAAAKRRLASFVR